MTLSSRLPAQLLLSLSRNHARQRAYTLPAYATSTSDSTPARSTRLDPVQYGGWDNATSVHDLIHHEDVGDELLFHAHDMEERPLVDPREEDWPAGGMGHEWLEQQLVEGDVVDEVDWRDVQPLIQEDRRVADLVSRSEGAREPEQLARLSRKRTISTFLTPSEPVLYTPPPRTPAKRKNKVHPFPQPEDEPLLSRFDWRLSCPILSPSSGSAPIAPAAGHNHLVGIGLPPSLEARRRFLKPHELPPEARQEAEKWGWKTPAPLKPPRVRKSEAAAAPIVPVEPTEEQKALQHWQQTRLLRLLQLSTEAEEERHLQRLEAIGTEKEKEEMGWAFSPVMGDWVGEAPPTAEAAATEEDSGAPVTVEPQQEPVKKKRTRKAKAKKEGEPEKPKPKKYSGGRESYISIWKCENRDIVEGGSKLAVGDPVRITLLPVSDNEPVSIETIPQGRILEFRPTGLVVAFPSYFDLSTTSSYRLEMGYDDSSFRIQGRAMQALSAPYTVLEMKARNETEVSKWQEKWRRATDAPGLLPEAEKGALREWSLRGTGLKELLVPPLPEAPIPTEVKVAAAREGQTGDEPDLASQMDHDEAEEDWSPASAPTQSVFDPYLSTSSSSTTVEQTSNPLVQSNQLLNSWVKRHSRDSPLSMPGDPELGLNDSQLKAVATSLGERLSLIQGPPGTGKSATIAAMIKLLKHHFRVATPILLAAPTHVSVDNLVALLLAAGVAPLRLGRPEKVRPEFQNLTVERKREEHAMWERTETTRKECEELRARVIQSQQTTSKSQQQLQQEQELLDAYRKTWRRLIAYEQRLYSSLFTTADVFCTTTIGASTNRVLDMIDFPLVLIDEAAMCTEPASLVPLMKGATQAIFIGDHRQLPAVVTSQEARKERLHVSLFERLMSQGSVKSTLLDTQYRMHPAISAFPNEAFYNSALRDADLVSQRSRGTALRSRFLPRSQSKSGNSHLPIAFVSHDFAETYDSQSVWNASEVKMIIAVVADLLEQNASLKAEDIGIISPYAAQTAVLQQAFQDVAGGLESQLTTDLLSQGGERLPDFADVEVNTIDGFQGREKKVILLSTVRSNKAGQIGFLTDRRRLNVALTRAKDALIVVGNAKTLRRAADAEWAKGWEAREREADVTVWRRFLRHLDERGAVLNWQDVAHRA